LAFSYEQSSIASSQSAICDRQLRGFSLVELLLTIGVLIMLAGLIWPNLTGRRERAQLEYIGSQMASTISYARAAAMSTGRRHRCVFQDGGSQMVIEWEADPVEAGGEFEPLKGQWARLNLIQEGVRCEMVDLVGYDKLLKERERELLDQEIPSELYEPIELYPDGRCDSGTIVLSAASGERLELQLNGFTGQVRVSRRWQGKTDSE